MVRLLVAQGYAVHFTYFRSVEQAADLCEVLRHEYPEASVEAISCDLARAEEVEVFCAGLNRNPQGFYGFIHCAGMKYDSLVATLDISKVRQLMQINFYAFIQIFQAVVPNMVVKCQGRIIAISSIAAQQGNRGNSLYGASKSALEGFVRSAIHEVAQRGVTLNCIAPGFIETRMTQAYSNQKEQICRSIPGQRFGTAQEVAELASFLLSPQAQYINGETLVIDGGLTKCARVI